jgi:hypothetical protein
MRASFLITGLALMVAAATAAPEPVYKWRDERGGVHYGEKPPPGVRATLVDTQPNLSQGASKAECVGTNCPPSRSDDAPRIRRDEPPPRPAGYYPGPTNGLPEPRGLDFDVYVRLQSGMSEGELLVRAGPPDFEAVDNLRGRIGKSYYYFPTSSNPYTTIVTLRGGRIFNIERVKRF